VREQEIVMRKLDALNKLYHRPPTNEHIERDFHKELQDAWLAVACLYDYLEALHKDDLLYCPNNFVETALEDLKEVRDRLGQDQGCYFELDLPPDSPEVIAAEKAYLDRAASLTDTRVHQGDRP
jgi:hypothetical protein